MRGPEAACQLVADALAARVPPAAAAIEARQGLPAGTVPVPPPGGYLPHDVARVSTDDTPTVLVVAQDTPNVVGREPGDGHLAFDVTYRLRVFVFVRGHGYGDVDAARKRLTLAVREGLLSAPKLDADAAVSLARWRESYSDVVAVDRGRSLAGAYVEVDVTIAETLPIAAWGEVAATVVTEGLLPPHPAL